MRCLQLRTFVYFQHFLVLPLGNLEFINVIRILPSTTDATFRKDIFKLFSFSIFLKPYVFYKIHQQL